MSPDWIIWIFAIGPAVLWVFAESMIWQRLRDRSHGKELGEPFAAEVLYRGKAIADLTDREYIEMFWREYRIEPRTDEAKRIIEDDDLWDKGAFTFRDPNTGNVCTSSFVGGMKPFIRDGKISLRRLYFRKPTNRCASSST